MKSFAMKHLALKTSSTLLINFNGRNHRLKTTQTQHMYTVGKKVSQQIGCSRKKTVCCWFSLSDPMWKAEDQIG